LEIEECRIGRDAPRNLWKASEPRRRIGLVMGIAGTFRYFLLDNGGRGLYFIG